MQAVTDPGKVAAFVYGNIFDVETVELYPVAWRQPRRKRLQRAPCVGRPGYVGALGFRGKEPLHAGEIAPVQVLFDSLSAAPANRPRARRTTSGSVVVHIGGSEARRKDP